MTVSFRRTGGFRSSGTAVLPHKNIHGQLGDCNTPLSEVRDDLIAELSYSSKKTVTQIPVEQFEQMLEDREQSLKSPVFEKSLQEVFGTPELEIWRISHHANTACKEQFDQEFGPAYHAADCQPKRPPVPYSAATL